jgi:hypothetical protein
MIGGEEAFSASRRGFLTVTSSHVPGADPQLMLVERVLRKDMARQRGAARRRTQEVLRREWDRLPRRPEVVHLRRSSWGSRRHPMRQRRAEKIEGAARCIMRGGLGEVAKAESEDASAALRICFLRARICASRRRRRRVVARHERERAGVYALRLPPGADHGPPARERHVRMRHILRARRRRMWTSRRVRGANSI